MNKDDEPIEPIDYNPDVIIEPIATILEFTGMKISELVERGCWPGITKEMAHELAYLTDYPVEFWLNLEKNYQEALANEN